MGRIILYEHHSIKVKVDSDLKGKHRAHCLCFRRCKYFKPNCVGNCPIAQMLFEFDKRYGMTTPVWECPRYRSK